jgi:hypothetical protein
VEHTQEEEEVEETALQVAEAQAAEVAERSIKALVQLLEQ